VYRIRNQIMARSPGDRDSQENLVITEMRLGGALAVCGDEEGAARYARTAVHDARELTAVDATQGDWRLELAQSNRLLGGIARSTGHFDQAAGADSEAIRILTELVAMDQTNTAWRRELARAQVEFARLQLATGNVPSAENLLNTALTPLERERASGAANRNLQLYESEALIALGEVAQRHQNLAARREHWEQARGAISSAAQVGADPDFLANWTKTLLLIGDTDAARPVLKQLATIGYQTPDFEALLKTTKQSYRIQPVALRCGSDPTPATRADGIH
jgi:tetratricopeptide (TPR) repeat protein